VKGSLPSGREVPLEQHREPVEVRADRIDISLELRLRHAIPAKESEYGLTASIVDDEAKKVQHD
jgi:hypothetical protein